MDQQQTPVAPGQQVLIFRIPPESEMAAKIKAMQEEDTLCRRNAQVVTGSKNTVIATNHDGEIAAVGVVTEPPAPRWAPNKKEWKLAKMRLKDGSTEFWSPRKDTKEGRLMLRRLRQYDVLSDTRIRALIGCAFGIKIGGRFQPVTVRCIEDAGWVFVFPMHVRVFEVAKKFGLLYIPAPGQAPAAAEPPRGTSEGQL